MNNEEPKVQKQKVRIMTLVENRLTIKDLKLFTGFIKKLTNSYNSSYEELIKQTIVVEHDDIKMIYVFGEPYMIERDRLLEDYVRPAYEVRVIIKSNSNTNSELYREEFPDCSPTWTLVLSRMFHGRIAH